MRLGDLDRIVQDVRENNAGNYDKRDWTSHLVVTLLENAPTIDAVPVVRCRDCKWFNHYTMECESDDVATDHEGGASFSINFGPDDFCSYGQRKEADHDKHPSDPV